MLQNYTRIIYITSIISVIFIYTARCRTITMANNIVTGQKVAHKKWHKWHLKKWHTTKNLRKTTVSAVSFKNKFVSIQIR